ncbi:MAG: pyridoxine 5'-phosphate synthase [Planctomycetota bacterium]
MPTLGVNIDHVATVRQARRTFEPDPVQAVTAAEAGGADQITIHLRQDRRHIQDRDVHAIAEMVKVRLNFECACVDEMLQIAIATKPHQICLVPEKREEVTTEGGLDIVGGRVRISTAIELMHANDINVSLFIDPVAEQIDCSNELGADAVELHTGCYANASDGDARDEQLRILSDASQRVLEHGMQLHAGHGLTYTNVIPVAAIPGMEELNIGHTIVSRSIFVGLEQAVREMKELISV